MTWTNDEECIHRKLSTPMQCRSLTCINWLGKLRQSNSEFSTWFNFSRCLNARSGLSWAVSVSWTLTGGRSMAWVGEDENKPSDGNDGHRTVNMVTMSVAVCSRLDGTVGKSSREVEVDIQGWRSKFWVINLVTWQPCESRRAGRFPACYSACLRKK